MAEESDSAKQGGAQYEIDPATGQATDSIAGRAAKEGMGQPSRINPGGLGELAARQKKKKELEAAGQKSALDKIAASPSPGPSPRP